MDDNGWVVQERKSPNDFWVANWSTASKYRIDAILEWDADGGHWEEWETWGRVRCVPCGVLAAAEEVRDE